MLMKKVVNLSGNFIKAIFTVMFVFIFLDVILLSFQNYYVKQKFFMSNVSLILISFAVLALATFALYKKYNLIEKALSRNWKIKIGLAVTILFTIQVFICINIVFFTGWDACNVLINAKRIATYNFGKLDNVYFSRYPNNLFLVGLFSQLFKVCSVIGISSEKNQLLFIITIQCILSSAAGLMIFLTIKDWLKSFTLSWLGWILYVILLGTSPWLVIPYSDSMGLLVPIAVLRIYHHVQNGRDTYLKWASIAALSFVGYQIKPQTLIVFIAIVIIQLVHLVADLNVKSIKKSAAAVAVMMATVIMFSTANTWFTNSLGFKLDKNKEIGMMHFAMMGLNDVTDGVYYAKDVKYSFDFHDVKSRNEGNMKVIKKRINRYSSKGTDFIMHIIRKALINFNDGTFAYGKEGGFYNKVFPNDDSIISPMLRSIFWVPGKYYKYFSATKQSVWLLVLLMMIIFIFSYSKFNIEGKEQQSLYLSLIGITVFEMIFEPRARYLIIYAPFFIIAGVLGWRYITKTVKEKYNS